VTGRISLIRKQIDDTDSNYDREKLQERLAKLAGGVASSRSARHRDRAQREEAPVRGCPFGDPRAVEEGIVPAAAPLHQHPSAAREGRQD